MSRRARPALLLVLGLASSALAAATNNFTTAATNFTFVWGDSFGNPINFSTPLDLSKEYGWLGWEYFELPYNATVDRQHPSLYPNISITLCSDLVEYRPVVLVNGSNAIGPVQSSINHFELSDRLAKMNPRGPPDGKVWFYQAHLYDAKNVSSAPPWSTDSPRFAITNIRLSSAARASRPDFGVVVAGAVAAAGGILVGYW